MRAKKDENAMKKLMIVAAIAAAAFGLKAELASANVVGYKKYSLDLENPDDYVHNMGIQFSDVATGSYTIENSIFGTMLTPGDIIFIFDPLYYGYTLYEYAELSAGNWGFMVTFADGSSGDPIKSLTVNKGDNILYMPFALEVTPCVSGEIQKSGTATLDFTITDDDYIFPITNPFPGVTKLSDLTCLQESDQLFVWDSLYYGYTLYEYALIEEGKMGLMVTYADGSSGEPITDPSTVIFGEGQGGLYMPAESRTWTVTFNY